MGKFGQKPQSRVFIIGRGKSEGRKKKDETFGLSKRFPPTQTKERNIERIREKKKTKKSEKKKQEKKSRYYTIADG